MAPCSCVGRYFGSGEYVVTVPFELGNRHHDGSRIDVWALDRDESKPTGSV